MQSSKDNHCAIIISPWSPLLPFSGYPRTYIFHLPPLILHALHSAQPVSLADFSGPPSIKSYAGSFFFLRNSSHFGALWISLFRNLCHVLSGRILLSTSGRRDLGLRQFLSVASLWLFWYNITYLGCTLSELLGVNKQINKSTIRQNEEERNTFKIRTYTYGN